MDKDKTTNTKADNQNQHFGVVNLPVHYTLAAGLAEQLGDQVEWAVAVAISKIGSNKNVFTIGAGTIRMDHMWHKYRGEADQQDALSIHLSNDLESELTFSVDWIWF